MKKRIFITGISAFIIMLLAAGEALAGNPSSGPRKDTQQQVITIKGKVIDAETGTALVFAGVAIKESNVSTVTNLDGEFIIKVAQGEGTNLEFSFVGYKNKVVPISEMKTNGNRNVIEMEQSVIPIREIVVKPMLPEEILLEAMNRFDKNYPAVPNEMTGFYRETIRKNRNYISIGEAVLEIFKAPYQNDLRFDAVRIYKGRKNSDASKMDTVLFKLQGGPTTALYLDIVKNPELLLTREALNQYDVKLLNIVNIDDRANYVISFAQKASITNPLYLGKIYVDIKTFAIAQAEFSFNLSDKELAATQFIRKKPFGMHIVPENTSYLVRYRMSGEKWYFNYSRAEVKFEVNWKKKLFNTTYTTMSELAVTDRTEEDVLKFAAKERIKPTDVFNEEVMAFADPDFWGDYNLIEPDQSIETAIRRLSRKLKFSERSE